MTTENRCFEQTFQQLESIYRLLRCTKCGKLPKEKVWTLGSCLHKYCGDCADKLSGMKCVSCGKVGYPKDVKPDLFFSSILSAMPPLYSTISRLDELSQEKDDEDKQMPGIENVLDGLTVEDFEATCESGKVQCDSNHEAADPYEFDDAEEDKSIFQNIECTPRPPENALVSQDFPEVLEETPQNKARGRHSIGCRDKPLALPVRNLTFPSQGPGETKDSPLKSPATPGKDFKCDSDEELFRSQSLLRSPPVELPVLTPYQNASKSKTARVSDESAPPALTPHKNEAKEVECAPEQGPSTRGKRARRKSSSSLNLNLKTSKDRKAKVQQDPSSVKTPGSSEHTPARRRRNSSASVASSTSSSVRDPSLRGPLNKRNAKGETSLHVACRIGDIEKVQRLIDVGADVNAKDHAGYTPIHEIINGKGSSSTKAEILRLVCKHGGDVNALGGLEDETPLHSAVQSGLESLVEILLEFGASPNIRNADGQLPIDLAFNEVINKLLEEKMESSRSAVTPSSTRSKNPNLKSNESPSTSSSSVVDLDPAVLQIMLKKAVIYFNYDVDPDVVKATKTKLGLIVSENLTCKVTHVVHQLPDSSAHVPLSMEYLYAVAFCRWQVSSDWITNSLKQGTCQSPSPYEILGHQSDNGSNGDNDDVPRLSRRNHENGHPGLLNGFSFYLYKTCGYTSPTLTLNKKQLVDLIIAAGGSVINREPSPDGIDPLEGLQRYHALNNVREEGSQNNSNEKFIMTSHIILYDERSPPPASKLYSMEHVKSLKSAWLVDSLSHFKLEPPEKYM